MFRKYLNYHWEKSLIAVALFIALLGTGSQAADMAVTPNQLTGPQTITASRSRVIWGQPVTFTANVQQNEVLGDVTFYDDCLLSERKLGVGEFVSDDAVQLDIRASQLHLGSNDIAISYFVSPTTQIVLCSAKVITVLPVSQ